MKIFNELCYNRQYWQVWSDLMTVMACSLANVADRAPTRFESREKEYQACIERLGGVEKPSHLFAIVVEALESNSDQDFLGALYMQLELGNHWKGQFFTPYCVSRAMAELTMGDCRRQIEQDGWISVCDSCVGGGAMLVAAANTLRRQDINYQNHVLFVGQDIDRIVGMMAYIQISLLGCPGYIVIANTITNPLIGDPLMPTEQKGQEFWYTPLYFNQVWHWRRTFRTMDALFRNQLEQKLEKETEQKAVSNQIISRTQKSKQARNEMNGQISLFDNWGDIC
ncbi:MAG: N-6 DNA methylase [Lachnospiraceae bacterium]